MERRNELLRSLLGRSPSSCVAEGIESALSAMQLFLIPCWATLGNERFGLVTIPESIRQLHLFVPLTTAEEVLAKL